MSEPQLVSVRLDADLWRQVRRVALERGEPASAFVAAALRSRLTAVAVTDAVLAMVPSESPAVVRSVPKPLPHGRTRAPRNTTLDPVVAEHLARMGRVVTGQPPDFDAEPLDAVLKLEAAMTGEPPEVQDALAETDAIEMGDIGVIKGRYGLFAVASGAPPPENIVPVSASAKASAVPSETLTMSNGVQCAREDFIPATRDTIRTDEYRKWSGLDDATARQK